MGSSARKGDSASPGGVSLGDTRGLPWEEAGGGVPGGSFPLTVGTTLAELQTLAEASLQ